MIEAKNLSIGYDKKPLQKQIDFNLDKGSFCALIGPNGVGKTTLLKTLLGWQKPLQGELFMSGKNLNNLSALQLSHKVSVVWSSHNIPENLKVSELLQMGRQPHTNWWGRLTSIDTKIIETVQDDLRIKSMLTKPCGSLSDGELQRVLIAKAMIQDTEIILLDEPTSHLDVGYQIEIIELLKTIAQHQQKILLFSTHQIELALKTCTNVLVFAKEKNLFGNPKEIKKDPNFIHLFKSNGLVFSNADDRFI